MGLFISLGMSFIMSFAMVAFNTGPTDRFVSRWFGAWFIGFVMGLPTAAIIIPVAKTLTTHLVEAGHK